MIELEGETGVGLGWALGNESGEQGGTYTVSLCGGLPMWSMLPACTALIAYPESFVRIKCSTSRM